MGSYPVPGDWFENMAAPSGDDDYLYPDAYDDVADAEFDEENRFDVGDAGEVSEARNELALVERIDPRPAHRYQQVELDPFSDAVRQLRRLARRLASEHHPLAHVPQQVANALVDAHAPPPQVPAHPTAGSKPEFAPSPTGNCRRCHRALPLPTMKRGRPRTLCEFCSPPRAS